MLGTEGTEQHDHHHFGAPIPQKARPKNGPLRGLYGSRVCCWWLFWGPESRSQWHLRSGQYFCFFPRVKHVMVFTCPQLGPNVGDICSTWNDVADISGLGQALDGPFQSDNCPVRHGPNQITNVPRRNMKIVGGLNGIWPSHIRFYLAPWPNPGVITPKTACSVYFRTWTNRRI